MQLVKHGKPFDLIASSLKDESNFIWNNLPQDTLIACLLDPRFKDMDYFPEEEQEEAWVLLQQEISELTKSDVTKEREIIIQDKVEKESKKRKEISELNELFKSGKKIRPRKEEIEKWKELEEIEVDQDVLEWWKIHENEYPKIAQVAKKYLGIPASQAITERSFSTAKRVVCDSRSRLKPHHVSKLVVLHQTSTYFEEEKNS